MVLFQTNQQNNNIKMWKQISRSANEMVERVGNYTIKRLIGCAREIVQYTLNRTMVLVWTDRIISNLELPHVPAKSCNEKVSCNGQWTMQIFSVVVIHVKYTDDGGIGIRKYGVAKSPSATSINLVSIN